MHCRLRQETWGCNRFRQNGSADIWLLGALIFAATGVAVVLISFLVEALRRRPTPPVTLRWAPAIPIRHTDIQVHRVRYIKSGNGPTLVLLHTLRTQLDLFEKVVPKFAEQFTVYAIDYPGHGYSDIPETKYDARFFADVVEGFLDGLALDSVTLAGVSIGASISLTLAARQNPRVCRVIAVNPYDYDKGRGLARGSLLGWLMTMTAQVPIIGETFMRLRNFWITRAVFAGGVVHTNSIPTELLREMYLVGNRHGHYRAFVNLLRNSASWEYARKDYHNITVPVLLVWGDQDWTRMDDREFEAKLVPNASVQTVESSGHFLPLDRPDALVTQVRDFCNRA